MFRSIYSRSLAIRIIGASFAVGQTLLLARFLGAEALGIYSSLLAITTLLAIPIAAGIPTYLTREIARARTSNNTNKIRPLIRVGSRFAAIAAIVACAVLWQLYLLGLVPVPSWHYMVMLMVLIPLLGLDLISGGAMRGMSSAIKSQLPESFIRPLAFVVLLLLALALNRTLSLGSALVAFAGACLVSFIIGRLLMSRMLPKKNLLTMRIPLRKVFSSTSSLALLGGTTTLIGNLDILVLSSLNAFEEAGAYRVALQGVVLLLMIHNAISAVVLRDVASSIVSGDTEKTIIFADKSTFLSSIGTALLLLLMLIFGKLVIGTLFGSEYLQAYTVLAILGFGHFISSSTGPVFEILVMLSAQKLAILVNIASIFILIAISLVLAQWSIVLGVAVGSAVSNIIRNVIMAKIVFNRLGFDPSVVGAIYRRIQ